MTDSQQIAPILDDEIVVVDDGAEIVIDDDDDAPCEIVIDEATDQSIANSPAQFEAPSMDDVFSSPVAPTPAESAATEAPPRDANDDELRAAIARRDSEIVELKGQLAAALRERNEAQARAKQGEEAVEMLAQPFYKTVEAHRAAGRGLMPYPGGLSKPGRASLRDAIQIAGEMIDTASKSGRPAQLEFSVRDVSTLQPSKPPAPAPSKKRGWFS